MKSEEQKQESGGRFSHWVWVDDDNESLCGKDMSNTEWLDDSVPIDCPGCIMAVQFLEELYGEQSA